jgi:hypothetical protein
VDDLDELVEKPSSIDFIKIMTDDVATTGNRLIQAGAVRLGKNVVSTSTGIFYILQGQLIIVVPHGE